MYNGRRSSGIILAWCHVLFRGTKSVLCCYFGSWNFNPRRPHRTGHVDVKWESLFDGMCFFLFSQKIKRFHSFVIVGYSLVHSIVLVGYILNNCYRTTRCLFGFELTSTYVANSALSLLYSTGDKIVVMTIILSIIISFHKIIPPNNNYCVQHLTEIRLVQQNSTCFRFRSDGKSLMDPLVFL